MSRPAPVVWRAARVAGGVAILAVVVWRLGTGPVVAGLESISIWPLVVAAALTLVATVCAAWRWCLVAQGLGIELPLPVAVAAYYRSQFLNTALPGGVVGDVHRGLSNGRAAGHVGRGLRAVMWERLAGQVVQLFATLAVLLVLPSPARTVLLVLVGVTVGCATVAVLLLRVVPLAWARTLNRDVRQGLRAWPRITVASAVIVVCHAATFLLAAHVAGSRAPLVTLLPLALLVLLAVVLPLSVGGWGPREGAAAWLFGAAGLGADRGVATATVYGVMVLVASLPGALVLVAGWRRQESLEPQAVEVAEPERVLVAASGEAVGRD